MMADREQDHPVDQGQIIDIENEKHDTDTKTGGGGGKGGGGGGGGGGGEGDKVKVNQVTCVYSNQHQQEQHSAQFTYVEADSSCDESMDSDDCWQSAAGADIRATGAANGSLATAVGSKDQAQAGAAAQSQVCKAVAAADVPQQLADDDAVLPCTAQSASASAGCTNSRSNHPTNLPSSPIAGTTKQMDARVAEALKILTTKSLSQSEYVLGRPASYHFDRDSSARRRYDWGTKHFYPDVHDITQPGSVRRPNKRRRLIAAGNEGPSPSNSTDTNNAQDLTSTIVETAVIKTATEVQLEKQNRDRNITTESNSSSDDSTAKHQPRTSLRIKRTKQREKTLASVQPFACVDVENVSKDSDVITSVKHREIPRGRKLSPRRHSAPVSFNDVQQENAAVINIDLPPSPLVSQLTPSPSPPLPPAPAPYFSPAQSLACISLPTLESPIAYFEDVATVGSELPQISAERLDFLDMINDNMVARQTYSGQNDVQETRTAKEHSFEPSPLNIIVTFQESEKPNFNFVASLQQHSEDVLPYHSQRTKQVERPAPVIIKSLEPPASREFALSGRVSAEDLFRMNSSSAPASGSDQYGNFAYQEDLLHENNQSSPLPVGSRFYSSGSARNSAQGSSREFMNRTGGKQDNKHMPYALSGRVSVEDSSCVKRYSPDLSDDNENEYAYQEDLLHENDLRSPLPVGSKFYSSDSARKLAKGMSREFVPRNKHMHNDNSFSSPVRNRIEGSSANREKVNKYSMHRKSTVDNGIRTAADELNNALHSLDAALMSLQKIDSNVTRNAGKASYTIRPVYTQTELDISKPGKSKIDARLLMLEEKERYREYKADYVRRVSSRDSTSGDEKSRDPADPKSPVLSRSSSRGSSLTSKSQWQLLHERQETVGYKSPDVLSVEAACDDVFDTPMRGRVLMLPVNTTKQPLLDDGESRMHLVQGAQQKPAKSSSIFPAAGSRSAWRASDVTVEAVMKSVGKKEKISNLSDTESDSSCRSSVAAKRDLLGDMGSFSPSVRAKYVDAHLHRFRNKSEQDDQLFENMSQQSVVDMLTAGVGIGDEVRKCMETKASMAYPSRRYIEQGQRDVSNQQAQKGDGDGRFFVATGNKSPLLLSEPVTARLKQSKKPHMSATLNTGYALEFVPMKQRSSMLLSSPVVSDSELQQSKAAAQYDSHVRDSREKYRAQFNATIDSLPATAHKDLSIEAAKNYVSPRLPVTSTGQVKPSNAQLSTGLTSAGAIQQQQVAAKHSSPIIDSKQAQLRVVGKKVARPYSEFISTSATNLHVSSQVNSMHLESQSASIARQSFVPYKSLKQCDAEPITRPTIMYSDKPLSSLLKPAIVSSPTIPPRYSQSQWQMRDEQKNGSLLKVLQIDPNLGAGELEHYDNCPVLPKPLPSPTSAEVERYSHKNTTQMPLSVGRVYAEPKNWAVPVVAVKARSNDKERIMSSSSSRDELLNYCDQRLQPQPVVLISTAAPSHLAEKVNRRNQNTASLARGMAISVPNLIVASDKGDSGNHSSDVVQHQVQQPVTLRSAKPLNESRSQSLLTAAERQLSHSSHGLALQPESQHEIYRSVQHLPRSRQTVDYSAPLSERSSSVSAIEQGQQGAASALAGQFVARRAMTPGSNDHKQLSMSENIKQRLTVTAHRVSLTKEQQMAAAQAATTLTRDMHIAPPFNGAVSLISKPRQFNVKNTQRQERDPISFSAPNVHKSDVATVDVQVENPVSFKSTPLPTPDEQMRIQVTCRPISPVEICSTNTSRKNSGNLQEVLPIASISNTVSSVRKNSGGQEIAPAISDNNSVFLVRKSSGTQQELPSLTSSVFPTRKNSGSSEVAPVVLFPVRKNSGGQQELAPASSNTAFSVRKLSGGQQELAPTIAGNSAILPVRKNSGGQELEPTVESSNTILPVRKNSASQPEVQQPVSVKFALAAEGEVNVTGSLATSLQLQPKSHFDVARNFVQSAVGDAIMREVHSVSLLHSLESTGNVTGKDGDSLSIRDTYSTDNLSLKSTFKPYEQTINICVSKDKVTATEEIQRLSDLSDKENVDMIDKNIINSRKSQSVAKVEQWQNSTTKAEALILPTSQPDAPKEKPVALPSFLAKDKNKTNTDNHKHFTPAHVTTVRLDSPSQVQQPSARVVVSEANLTVARLPVESNLLFSPVSMLSIGDLSDGEMTDATDFTMDMLVRQNEVHAAEEYSSKERVLLLQHHAASRVVSQTSAVYAQEPGPAAQVICEAQVPVSPKTEAAQNVNDGNGTPGVVRRASFKDLVSSFEAKSTPYMRNVRRQHNQQTEGGQSSSGEETSVSGGLAAGESASQCGKQPFILQLDARSDVHQTKLFDSDDNSGVIRPQWRRF